MSTAVSWALRNVQMQWNTEFSRPRLTHFLGMYQTFGPGTGLGSPKVDALVKCGGQSWFQHWVWVSFSFRVCQYWWSPFCEPHNRSCCLSHCFPLASSLSRSCLKVRCSASSQLKWLAFCSFLLEKPYQLWLELVIRSSEALQPIAVFVEDLYKGTKRLQCITQVPCYLFLCLSSSLFCAFLFLESPPATSCGLLQLRLISAVNLPGWLERHCCVSEWGSVWHWLLWGSLKANEEQQGGLSVE